MIRHRVAIIGAGPAGFFAAEHLLGDLEGHVHVDMYDRLPTPWGLVRAGVAPDHPKIKSVSAQFDAVAEHPRYRYFGNIEFGRDVSRVDLLARYDAVLYAVGARSERRLGVEGEDLPGSLAASDFVAWYNGHPDLAALDPDLSGRRAVVVGNGNVALDVARILLMPVDRLRATDIADHALAKLEASRIREVVLVGRRGAAQASFTIAELREIVGLPGVDVEVDAAHLSAPDDLEPAEARRVQRNLAVFAEVAGREAQGAARRLRFAFLRAPSAIRGTERVERIDLAITRLERGDGPWRAVATGEQEQVPADLVIRAVGYRGVALPGVAFDEITGTIPHEAGRVRGGTREYVAGWIKRGPTGIIGTNRSDAVETATRLLADLAASAPRSAPAHAIDDWLSKTCPERLDQSGWKRIDAHEIARGRAADRPRVKLVELSDMLGAAQGPLAASDAMRDAVQDARVAHDG